MRKKTKLIVTICSMLLVLSAMIVGVYAASTLTLSATATINFSATNVECQIIGRVVGASSVADADYDAKVLYNTSTPLTTWTIGALNLNYNTTTYIEIGVLNTHDSIKFTVVATGSQTSAADNVTYTYKQAAIIASPPTTLTATNLTSYHGGTLTAKTYNTISSGNVAAGKAFYFEVGISASDWANSISGSAFTLSITIDNPDD